MKEPYYSALKTQKYPDAYASDSMERFVGANGISMAWDFGREGLPPEMMTADVIYGEPPWKHGYDLFAKEAGVSQAISYADFIKKLVSEIGRTGKPSVIIAGAHAMGLYKGFVSAPALINGAKCYAMYRCIRPHAGTLDATEVIKRIARMYDCIADPFCGYGRAGRIFAEHGKRYVMSDLNPVCIGYISKQSWA